MDDASAVVRLGHDGDVEPLLARYGLILDRVNCAEPISGSYWGDEEAGLIGQRLLARADTPLHSILHEACHYICMSSDRRQTLHTDAGGDDLEEAAVCYLSILLSTQLNRLGQCRMLRDMDRWGYSFRLGSAAAWFAEDAADAKGFLLRFGLIDDAGRPTYRVRC